MRERELDREQYQLDRAADAKKHETTLRSMLESTKKMPPLPKLDTKEDWPKFWRVMRHYLSKSKYSPGKVNKLEHVTSANDLNNEVASKNVYDALFMIMTGDAAAKFECQDDTYLNKGFLQLAVLKRDWDSSSTTQIFKQCFEFFNDHSQGDQSPDVYEKGLRMFF